MYDAKYSSKLLAANRISQSIIVCDMDNFQSFHLARLRKIRRTIIGFRATIVLNFENQKSLLLVTYNTASNYPT
jgi:hypothetical protein